MQQQSALLKEIETLKAEEQKNKKELSVAEATLKRTQAAYDAAAKELTAQSDKLKPFKDSIDKKAAEKIKLEKEISEKEKQLKKISSEVSEDSKNYNKMKSKSAGKTKTAQEKQEGLSKAPNQGTDKHIGKHFATRSSKRSRNDSPTNRRQKQRC